MDDTLDNEAAGISEELIASGEAGNVLDANRQAWEAFESVQGNDDPGAWTLRNMQHAVVALGQLAWTATFVRDPDAPTPPNVILTDASKIEKPAPATIEEAIKQEHSA
jgi:hypothetical protein